MIASKPMKTWAWPTRSPCGGFVTASITLIFASQLALAQVTQKGPNLISGSLINQETGGGVMSTPSDKAHEKVQRLTPPAIFIVGKNENVKTVEASTHMLTGDSDPFFDYNLFHMPSGTTEGDQFASAPGGGGAKPGWGRPGWVDPRPAPPAPEHRTSPVPPAIEPPRGGVVHYNPVLPREVT
jgi:hypothetical protein